ncbi:MAG: hypothetical protein C5B52_08215 [Bacteroidetes bacterium]|nr:MAG: hypothetical protein C5B52_08215 [Bacteroidota bacterium]
MMTKKAKNKKEKSDTYKPQPATRLVLNFTFEEALQKALNTPLPEKEKKKAKKKTDKDKKPN